MREAMLYEQLSANDVVCNLCAHRCRIQPGRQGICQVRINRGGTLYSMVSDRVAVVEVDRIQKKPFYHFQPGTSTFSIATTGCNMCCRYCQNYGLSQAWKRGGKPKSGHSVTPGELVEAAKTRRCRSISYTYNEPTVFFELAYETARVASANGLKNLFVTNGYMTPGAIRLIHPYLDGANVDLKGFDDRRYRRVCGARLQPILDSIRLMHHLGIWIEVTTLVIPGHNDSDGELRAIAEFLASVSYNIPWHVTGFFPTYDMRNVAPTTVETLHRAYTIGRSAGLHYVYCGNIPADLGRSTFCHGCHTKLIERSGFTVLGNWTVNGNCPNCGVTIAGVEMSKYRPLSDVA